MSASAERLLFLALSGLLGCNQGSDGPELVRGEAAAVVPSTPPTTPAAVLPVEPDGPAPLDRIDAHVHLVDAAADELLAAMDRHGIAMAVVLSSPHLDPSMPPPPGPDVFGGWRQANDRLLEQTKDHRSRLIPFVTVDLAKLRADELEAWQQQGACGVKIYAGHQNFHRRALDARQHDEAWTTIERLGMPVLLHLNTVRFEPELGDLLAKYPNLSLLCSHLCGARTDLDRFERIMQAHPDILFDTSHGPGQPGVEGFTKLEADRDRLHELIEGAPERFLFGSDLVTVPSVGDPAATRLDWDRQIAANLGLLEAERFEFFRETQPGAMELGSYEGLALDGAVREAVLVGNAARWLGRCLGGSASDAMGPNGETP